MMICPMCDTEIDIEEEDLGEGDDVTCDECGASLRVASLNPLELESAEEDEEDDEDEDLEDFDEDEDDDEEEEEEEWR